MAFIKQLTTRVTIGLILLSVLLTPFSQGWRDPISVIIISFAVAILSYIWLTGTKRRVSVLPKWLWLTLGAFVAWQLISILWNDDKFSGISAGIILIQVAFVFVISLTLLRRKQARDWLITFVALGGVVLMSVGLIYFLMTPFNKTASAILWVAPYSLYSAVLLLLSLYKLSTNPRGLWYFAAILSLASLVMTQTPLMIGLALILALVLLFFTNEPKARMQAVKKLVIIALGSAVIVLGVIGLKQITFKGRDYAFPSGLESANGLETTNPIKSLDYWQGALKTWLDQPVIGSGLGSFTAVYTEFQRSPEAAIPDAHNAYLGLASEGGLIGLLLLAALLIFIATRWVKGPKEIEQLYIGAIALITGIYIAFFPSIRFPFIHFWLAVLFAYLIVITRPRAATNRIDPKLASILVVISFLLLVPSVSIFRSRQFGQKAFDYYRAGKLEQARTSFGRANSQWLRDPDNLTQESLQAWLAGDIDQAQKLVDEAIAADPKDATNYDLKAYYQNRLGETEQASENYERAKTLDPYNNPDLYSEYGLLLARNGKLEEAKNLLDDILSKYKVEYVKQRSQHDFLDRRVARMHFERARIAFVEGDTETAKEHAQKAIDIYPDFPSAKQLLEILKASAPANV